MSELVQGTPYIARLLCNALHYEQFVFLQLI